MTGTRLCRWCGVEIVQLPTGMMAGRHDRASFAQRQTDRLVVALAHDTRAAQLRARAGIQLVVTP